MYFIRLTDQTTQWVTNNVVDPSLYWTRTISHKQPHIFTHEPIHIIDMREIVDSVHVPMKQASFSYITSILKSTIQKTIRRGKLDECLSTTQQLLRQDPADTLRRLPVIFAEDTMIHPESFSLVVWLMVAHSKGYLLSARDEELVLDAVTTACSAPKRYEQHFYKKGTIVGHGYSLALRAAYGGMKGDLSMLNNMAMRLDTMELLTEWVISPVVTPFSVYLHIIPESIDFHCCPSIVIWCAEKTGLPMEKIRTAIWNHWSSPNGRKIEEVEASACELDQGLDHSTYMTQLYPLLVMYAQQKIKWLNASKKKLLTQTTLNQFMSIS